jgi:succinate dehydrogenase / fumarate reductase cytochrome b subunit
VLAFLVHIFCAVSLTLENRKARGDQGYAVKPNGAKGSSIASQTMAIQGSLILFFLITHIISFKYGTYYETTVNGVVMRDLYRLLHETFQNPGFVIWYLVSLVVLGFHLSHGFGSSFQSLGIKNDRTAPVLNKLSLLYGVVVAGGFIAQPIFMFFFAGK